MSLKINHESVLYPVIPVIIFLNKLAQVFCCRVEDRLMNYLPAHELFTKLNHKPIDLHYKFNIFSIIFVPLHPVTYNIIHL